MRSLEKRYTPSEVAERLGVKVGTIYAMLSRGEIQAYHVGRRRVFTESQVMQFKASRGSVEVDMTYACGPALQLS
jgi:excisionase family DNA binding protein